MNLLETQNSGFKFCEFRLDDSTGELFSKNNERIKLQPQPTKVLFLLVENAGKLVTREEIHDLLWEKETFVDYEQGVNYCIKQIRIALHDDAQTPQFIETLPTRGYRFIARVADLNKRPSLKKSQHKDKAESQVENPRKPVSLSFFQNAIFLSTAIPILLIGLFFVLSLNFSSLTDLYAPKLSNNPVAQEAFFIGKHLLDKGEIDSIKKSIKHFDLALQHDNNFVVAYLARADAFYQLGVVGNMKASVVFPKAKADALRALQLGNTSDVRTLLGSLAFRYEWNWEKAEDNFKQAIALDPYSAKAHHDYAWLLVSQKRFAEAITSVKKAQKLDATSPRINADISQIYLRAKHYEGAFKQIKRTSELEPSFVCARYCMECLYFGKATNRESVNKGIDLMKTFNAPKKELDQVRKAPYEDGVKLVEKWRLHKVLELSKTSYIPEYDLAVRYASVDNGKKAFIWLTKALQERNANLVTIQVDRVWDKFRKDSRFSSLFQDVDLNLGLATHNISQIRTHR